MKINLIELPYHPYVTLNLFDTISSTEWSMLLYSDHNSKHPDSRFDILVTNPILTLSTQNNITTISYNNKKHEISNKDPFLILKKYMQDFQLQSNDNYQIPFQGGFIGVFGYDLIRSFESLPKQSKKDLHFPDMAIGLYRWAIITDHKLFKNYLVTHDNPNPILSWIYKNQNIHDHNAKTTFNLLNTWSSNLSYIEYLKRFNIIKKHLKLGNCYQICLSQRFHASYIGNTWIAFRTLLYYNKSPFAAFIQLPKKLSVLNFSPERFIQIHNSNIKTQPIKRTLRRLQNPHDDHNQIIKLSQSVKDQSENLMIVDLLRNDIGKVALPGSIHVTNLFDIQSFSGVHHMVSTIIGKLDDNFHICDLLRACFAGGSITGAPKIQAMKLIDTLEPQCRNVWSGSIGYLSCCGNMDTNIIIRTLLSKNQHLFCSVGSAIVFESDAITEYQEMQDKIFTLLNPLIEHFYLKK